MIRDPYGRPVNNLRISVTQKCNLNCFYCHREGETEAPSTEMSPDEIATIVEVASRLGVRKVKLTGGEPLLRKDILEIVRRIKDVPGIVEVSLTTNGTLLQNLAHELAESGLDRVNVSLDSLNPSRYMAITGRNCLSSVLSGIMEAKNAGLNPVKVNMVLLRGVNEDEVWDMVEFSSKAGVILQLIELVSAPSTENGVFRRYHVDPAPIEEELRGMASRVLVRRMHHRRKYLLPGGAEVEVVRPMHNTEFCAYCTRMRVTSDGKLKPCLLRDDNLVDILMPIRRGASMRELEAVFKRAVMLRRPYFTG